eukprot:gene29990-37135_t
MFINGNLVTSSTSTARNTAAVNGFIGKDVQNHVMNGELYYLVTSGIALTDTDRNVLEGVYVPSSQPTSQPTNPT